MTSGPTDKIIRVNILGQDYFIRSSEDDKVRQVAEYITEHENLLKKNSPTTSRFDLCVMLAFKAISDLLDTREEFDSMKYELDRRIDSLLAEIVVFSSED